jgi:hypothetical protein
MWENLAEEVRECLRHAGECAARAKIEPHPAIQRDFIDMELRWLQLARSYQFLGSCALFQQNTISRVANFPRGWRNSKEKPR